MQGLNQAAESVQDILYVDELTGIHNRRFFLKEFPDLAVQAKEEDLPLTLAAVDVDYFKTINDTHGHHEGDALLIELAGLMKSKLPAGTVPIRYGGDEFIIMFPQTERDNAIVQLGDLARLVKSHGFKLKQKDPHLSITMSIGVGNFPVDTDDPSRLYDLADKAAYISKKMGRDRVSTIQDGQQESTIDLQNLHKLFPCPRLIGMARQDIIKDALKLVAPQAGGFRKIMVLEGQSGFGKSRLLEEVRRAADPQRTMIVRCVGLPPLLGQPFGVLVDAISIALRHDYRLKGVLTAALDAMQIALVSRFLPDLSPILGEKKSFSHTQDEQKRALVKSFVRMLLAWAGGKTLVLIFDDFQWVDPGTLEVLTALKEDALGASASVFIAIRPRKEFIEDNKHLTEFLQVQKERGNMVIRHLVPLDLDAIQEMVGAIFPGLEGNSRFVQMVYRKSHGIPLLVEEILKYLVQQERITLHENLVVVRDLEDDEIPSNIKEVLTLRMQRLDSDTRDVMSKASVLGEKFTVNELTAMEGRNEGYIWDAIDQARRAGILEVDPENPDVMRFSSSRAHDTLYNTVDRMDRARFHEKAAAVTEQVMGKNNDAALGHLSWHYERAGEMERAIQVAEQLVRQYGKIIPENSHPILISRAHGTRDWPKETPLPPELIDDAIQLARYLRASIQNFRMYPPNSEVVAESEAKVHSQVSDILEKADALTFAEATGVFLVNGQNVDPMLAQRGMLGDLTAALTVLGLKGVAFKKGLERHEVKAFLECLVLKESELSELGGWPTVMKERGIRNIAINEVLYVQVGERDIVLAKKAQPGTMLIKEVQARPDELHHVYEMSSVADLMTGGSGAPAPPTGEARVAALQQQLDKVTKILEELAKQVPLQPVVGPGGGLSPSGKMPNTMREATDEMSRLLSMQQEIVRNFPNLLKSSQLPADLQNLSDDPDVLCLHLESGDAMKVASATIALTAKKKQAVDPLIQLLIRTGDPRARKAALKIVEKVEGTDGLVERLINEMYKTEYREEKIHLFLALGEYKTNRVKAAIGTYIHYSDKETRRAALRILEATDSTAYCKELMRALKDRYNWVRADAAASLGHMRFKDAVRPLMKIIAPHSFFFMEEDPHVQKQACRALGFIHDPAAIPALVQALKGSFIPVVFHNKDVQVRAAAAMALAEFQDPRAERALARACGDPSVAVRAAAKVAYSRLKRTTMDFT